MATSVPNFSDFELKVEFRDDHVVHAADGVEEVWDRGEIIGRGGYGKVFLQKRQLEGGEELRAVKEVALAPLKKAGISQELLAFISTRDHDHLFVKFLGWYKNSHDMYFVMEYLKDGDLAVYMAQDASGAKERVKEITTQILRGLEVLHKKKICHRDLKPQNVLIASITPIWVKIADFGVAKQTANSTARSGCGTDNYRAPEAMPGILPRNRPRLRGFSYALDIWSLGSLLHELLTSHTPFLDLTPDETETGVATYTSPQRIIDIGMLLDYCRGRIKFPMRMLQDSQVSKEGIDFVKSLLVVSPEKRPTATIALQNPWLEGYTNNPLSQSVTKATNVDKALPLPNATKTAKSYRGSLVLKLKSAWGTINIPQPLKTVESGHADKVKTILKDEVDISNKNYKVIFLTAVKSGDLDTVKQFLSNDINVGLTFPDGSTVLQTAARGGHIDIVKLLLENKADVNAEANSYGGRTALQEAARCGLIDIVKLLLENKADVNAEPADHGGQTALQAAVESGHIDIAKLLLKNKADVNAEATSSYGRTALQVAAESRRIDIVKLLLENEADVNSKAARYSGRTALQAAAENGHIDIFKILLENKADVNAEAASSHGRTALQAAAESGHIDIVKLLLENEADVNTEAAIYNGRTALQTAAGSGHINIVKLLLKNKADVNAEAASYYGQTALQAAAGSGHIDIVKLLLENTADVNAEAASSFGRTALQAAAWSGHIDIVKLLLENKADVNVEAASYNGRTALQAAAENGHINIVKLLLANKADVNAGAASSFGRTALQAAAWSGHIDIVKLLLKNKADVNALDLVKFTGSPELISILQATKTSFTSHIDHAVENNNPSNSLAAIHRLPNS